MGFYIRKAISVGPLRFNLSKSGIGVSAGVKGFRVGSGPRGNYVHMGRGGLYFRQTLGPVSQGLPVLSPSVDPTVGPSVEIESGSVLEMADASSSGILNELNEKRRLVRFLPFAIGLVILATYALVATDAPSILTVSVLVSGGVGCWWIAQKDVLRKTTVIFYDFESDVTAPYEALLEAFSEIAGCNRVWHVQSKADVHNRKYHAGANSVVSRKAVRVSAGQPPLVKCNIDVPLLPAGRQMLAFMPDRVLVFDVAGVGAVRYSDLELDHGDNRFIEEESVPSDATVVDKTWRFVNKKGGPDRRFSNNRELPVCLYSRLLFQSASGLNELFHVSRRALGAQQTAALRAMSKLRGELNQPSSVVPGLVSPGAPAP